MEKCRHCRYSTTCDNPTETSVLRYVLCRYADDTISEEQVRRVMEPIRQKIMEKTQQNPTGRSDNFDGMK